MFLKHKYFQHNNIAQLADDAPVGRKILAQRELMTFGTLCALGNIECEFDKATFLDLGAGDQFLKLALDEADTNYLPLDVMDVDFDMDPLPIDDSSVDILFSLAVLEHINNTDHFLSERYRVLKPGGVIYLSTPNFKYCYKQFYDDPTHVRPFTDLSLKQIVDYYEFTNVEVYPGARCKSDWFYTGKYRFSKCRYLPFLGSNKWAPAFLCGRATSIFCLGQKPK
jgi:SAM-dependent methyltransferase